MGETNNFTIWAQNVLPIVFDDYVSQKDLFVKMVRYINGLIGDTVTLFNDFTALDTTTIGDLEDLHTTEKGSVVGAINEVKGEADTLTVTIGDLDDLQTTEKTSVVGAINELDTDKLDKPALAGTSGQVLTSDGEGGQVWAAVGSGEIVVDNTLTVSGAAADAKVTGDEIGALKADNDQNVTPRLSALDGYSIPQMELGTIAFASNTIAYQDNNNGIRTPSADTIRVNAGDVISLTDYTKAKFKISILKDSDGNYQYTDYRTSNYTVQNAGRLYLVVAYNSGATVSNVEDLTSIIRIQTNTGAINELLIADETIKYSEEENKMHQCIVENNMFLSTLFGAGEISAGKYDPLNRKYRVSSPNKLCFCYDIRIAAENGYRLSTSTFANYETTDYTWSGWQTSMTIPANSVVLVMLAKTSEDTSVVADPAEFVTHFIVNTDLTNRFPEDIVIDANAISEYMARFYLSNTTKSEEYAFFTDPHLMGTNGTFSEELFKKYIDNFETTVKRTSAFYVVCGGDWLNNGDTKEQASVKLGYVDGQMRSRFPGSYYPIAGNHDFNYLGVDGNGNRLSEANWIGNHDMPSFWFQQYGECYYKFKAGIAQNYVLNTRTDYDGTNQYDKEMLDWLASSLIEDNPEHATLMFHIYRLLGEASTIPTRILAIGEIISAFNSHSICTLTEETHGYDESYDFTNMTGHIDYSIVGHSHADFIQTLGGVPIIATRNMQSGDIPTYDLVFADYTHGKLYLTRVGSGESRSVNI